MNIPMVHLTSVKVEELFSMVGPFLQWETNQSPALSEQFLLPGLGTGGQYHTVGDMHDVSKASVCIPVFISDVMVRLYQPANADVGNCDCS
jgi:hypothetical protein